MPITDEFEDAVREGLADISTPNSGFVIKRVGDGVLLGFEHFPDIVEWWLHFHGTLQFKVKGVEAPVARPFKLSAGDLKIKTRQCMRLVLRADQTLGFNRISRLEARLLCRCCVQAIEGSPSSLEQLISLLHRFFHRFKAMAVSGSTVSKHQANDDRTLKER